MRTRTDQNGRVCTQCFEYKLWSQFYLSSFGPTGYDSQCRDCRKKKNLKSNRASHLRRNYSLTEFEFEELFKRQKGLCKICNIEMTRKSREARAVNVDHCHMTGEVRGLLCQNCNKMLGYCKDDPDILRNAIIYLTANQTVTDYLSSHDQMRDG